MATEQPIQNETIPHEPIKWDIIAPEIKNDHFYYSIMNTIARDADIHNIIEIGASSGEGSTEAIILGVQENRKLFPDNKHDIYSLEVCTERYNQLSSRYRNFPGFHPYNISSVGIDEFPSWDTITKFYNTTRTSLNRYQLPLIKTWYDNDIKYITHNAIPQNGIEVIKREKGIDMFDLALIDGSEFTGNAELDHLIGAKYILLDDINAFKNFDSHQRLIKSGQYRCITIDPYTRNGFSIFKRV